MAAVKLQSIPFDISAVLKEGIQEGWVACQEEEKVSLEMQERGKWAVDEHNSETKDNLEFVVVISGEKKSDKSGTTYMLKINVKNQDGGFENRRAVVWEYPRKLVYFDPVPLPCNDGVINV